MPTPIQLYSNNDKQVSSFTHLETELIDPSRKMHIFSGIAIPSFEIDDNDSIHSVTCEVDLGVAMPDVQQAAAQAGLASIANEESEFVFAVDNARVEPHPLTGRLRLIVDLAVMGDESAVNRFGFQAVVIAGARATGISGRVSWDKSFLDASNLSSEQLKTVVFIHANIVEPKTVHPDGFPSTQLKRIADTIPQSLHREGNDFWVPYSFDHMPLNSPLQITVDPGGGFPFGTRAGQVHGPFIIQLTPSHLSEAGVDFRIIGSDIR